MISVAMMRPAPPLQVLIVEDEALLAMDIEAMVEDSGHAVIAAAAALSEVQAMSALPAPDLVFIDVQLAQGSSGLSVSEFVRHRWPNATIIFITANPKKLPDDLAGALGIIPKPFSRAGLMRAMGYIEQSVCDPPPRMPLPASLIVTPAGL